MDDRGKYIPLSAISGNIFFQPVNKNLKMIYGKVTSAHKSDSNNKQTDLNYRPY